MDPENVPAKFEVRIALPVPEIIAIEVLGVLLRTPILGEEEALIHQRHKQTGRQTDERTDDMRSQYRALH